MKTIELTQGKYALVDDADFRHLSAHKWFAVKGGNTFYAARKTRDAEGKRHNLYMHNAILPDIKGTVDHRDRNGLNNSRSNLRDATYSQQSCNQQRQHETASNLKGVTFCDGKWMARIQVQGSRRYLGSFQTKEQASVAYNEAAKELHGEYQST